MVRAVLFLSILAICLTAGSSSFVARTKRAADGETIQCHSGNKFDETEKITGGKCGYVYQYTNGACTATNPFPYNSNDNRADLVFKKEIKAFTSYELYCTCDGEMCNKKVSLKECIMEAVKNDSISKINVTEDDCDQMIKCALKNDKLTLSGLRDSFTTTTTTMPSTTTTPMRSVAADDDSMMQTVLFCVIGAGVLLAIVGVVFYCCTKKSSKDSATKRYDVETGLKMKPKSANSKDAATTPTNVSTVSPIKSTVSPADATVSPDKTTVSKKTSEDDIVPKMAVEKSGSAEKPKRESKVQSIVKSNVGSIVKSNAKSVVSSMSSDNEGPKDVSGLIATSALFLKKGIEMLVDEMIVERKGISDTKYDEIDWVTIGHLGHKSTAVNAKCVVDLDINHAITKEYKKTRKRHKAALYNAHYVDKERRVIVGDSPYMPNQSEFLFLLYLYEVCAVITIGTISELDNERRHFLPRKGQTKVFGCFSVRIIRSESISDQLFVNTIEICLNGTRPRRFQSITFFWDGIDKKETAVRAARILDYIQRHIASRISFKSPILFQCPASSDRASSMAMLHMMITASSSQKTAIDHLPIFADVLCARRQSIKSRASLVFIFRAFVAYAQKSGVVKEFELGTWRHDVEESMKNAIEEDKKNESY